MSIAILGCGVSGILACLELIRVGKQTSQITCIDPYFDGGSLGRSWGGIYSNTRWIQILETLRDYPSAQLPMQTLSKTYKDEDRVLLSDLGWLLLESLRPYLQDLTLIIGTCSCLSKVANGWKVEVEKTTFEFQTVLLCMGGRQKTLDMGKPILPLEVALDSAKISRIVRPNQTVVVFGLQHSGTLVCKHLLACSANVIGVYKGESPFLFERDGHYDGIKQESAELADQFLSSPSPKLEFVKISDTSKLIKKVSKAAWIVCAIGFEGIPIPIRDETGTFLSESSYSPETGELYPNLYGFGLAYPGVTEIAGKCYKDVSIPSFVQQLRRCIPILLSKC